MKLKYLSKLLESDNEDDTPEKAPAPKGELVNGAQAAKILGVSMSRIRQYKANGVLTPERGPEPGSRDNWYKLTDITALKSKQNSDGELDRPGRPKESNSK